MDTETATPQTSEKRKTGTFKYSGTLPRVPLPALQETADRFLAWCSPLLSAEELQQTRSAVAAFTKPRGLGEKLHAALASYNDQSGIHSWLDIFWQSRYLGRRDPIALNANFFFLFQHVAQACSKRAASIVSAAFNYKLALDREEIPPAMNRQTPLCMDQVKYLFSATRIPGEKQDYSRSFYTDEQPGSSTARHILVLYQGHIFTLKLVNPQGMAHSLKDIEAGIDGVIKAVVEGSAPGAGVGHLTTMPRADWARLRKNLMGTSAKNAANLELIETALFAINLEDMEPADNLAACDQLLYGGKGNRWYDKALQLVIFKNGVAGINVEHCRLDGTTILNFVDAIRDADPQYLDDCTAAVEQGEPAYGELLFDLGADMQKHIAMAAEKFEQLTSTTVTRIFDFFDFGGNQIKKWRMSPDAFVQCAMQLAHFRAKGFVGATYESIATRQYERGRTEAMRTVTPEVLAFVKTIVDDIKSPAEKIASLRLAADKHVARARQCQEGQAPEQQLWELQNIYNRNPDSFTSGLAQNTIDEALALFESPGWVKMRQDALSTSSAPSPSIIQFGFGSTGPGCIGVGYLVGREEIRAHLSTARDEQQALEGFMLNWQAALRELADLLEHDPAITD